MHVEYWQECVCTGELFGYYTDCILCVCVCVCVCVLRVRLVERGAPQSLPLMESGTVSEHIQFVSDISV